MPQASGRHCALRFVALLVVVGSFVERSVQAVESLSPQSRFVRQKCVDCHTGESAEGGFHVDTLGESLDDPKTLNSWTRVLDRVRAGTMPPKEAEPLEAPVRQRFTSMTHEWLQKHQEAQFADLGRVRARRLTNLQLERTLQDLLGIDIPLAVEMPVEPKSAEFNTYFEGQPMSHFHLEQHLKIVDLALDEVFRRVLSPDDDQWKREMTAKEIARTRDRCREPEYIDNQAVVWSSRLEFYGRLPATEAKVSGWYRVQFQVRALKKPKDHGVWCSVRMGEGVSSAPLLAWGGSFEAVDEPQVVTMDVWLPSSHLIEIRPHDRTLKQARFQGGQASNGEGGSQDLPGIGIDWLSMERIHKGPTREDIRSKLFEGLMFKDTEKKDFRGRTIPATTMVSEKPADDIPRLITKFAHFAFRRKLTVDEVKPYIDFTQKSFADNNQDIAAALRAGFRSILCSPRFLYLQEQPGKLDNFALASRLSYFLWNSMPDTELLRLAKQGKLNDAPILEAQVDRMLKDPRGKNFVPDFTAQWLELDQIDFTEPDGKLYPDFDLVVQQSMLAETHAFVQHLLDKNAKVTQLVDSDFTFLNSRLARYYGLAQIAGDDMRLVSLKPDDPRGGLLGQGAILKVTANGTNTSPVLRGLWVARRIMGERIPAPPENVPAIEPDIRGAKTIRDQLEKHREEVACAFCHSMMDPPGFALENFDAAGRWRDNYLKLDNGRLKPGSKIDSGYVMADGRKFKDFNHFKKLVVAKPHELARNFAEKLLAYGTGAPIAYADRVDVERIVEESKAAQYGVRSIVKAVVKSQTFQTK